jgi:hypothetical protein
MKFIGHVNGEESYRHTVSMLRNRGIPVFTKYSGAPANWPTPYRAALYVVLDKHYEDAIALLGDPTHRVREPVDVQDYDEFISAQETSPLILKWALILLAIVLLILAMALYFSAR